ncbi:hypothetical protein SUGI_0687230 [Cryptomeria japonica]|nr:hypothetical protein SUGI_0687230 [Cryptomeria japonica]
MASSSGYGGRNAFDPIIPSASTCVASSSGMKQQSWDVFINHHGDDVKHTVASRIYNHLHARGLRVFLDQNELELGEFFPRALEQAIRSASIHIAIFSKNYARSAWCLAELAIMVETGTTIIPVFYHVQPSDLRWAVGGTGEYADAFSEHEKKGRYPSEDLQRWKVALQQVSCYIGKIIGDEQQVVKSVVNRILKEMDPLCLEVAKYPVGLDEVVQDFEKTAIQSAPENVQIVGIWGMGGIGKTTLAKEFYNRRCSGMDYASFLSDVQHAAESGELPMKQKKLLKDLDLDLDVRDVPLDNIAEGKQIVKNRWRSNQLDAEKSALIILDDVDHPDQLEALLPPRESLGHRNLIIVTTRELDVLNAWGISTVFKMRPLNETHAEQLFCCHAFLQQSPPPEFEGLVKKFIKACDGLPLSLKVLGAQLYGKSDKAYWQRTLNKILRILPMDIKKRLKVSYDALDEEEKQMFLDAACFFIGRRTSTAIAVWDGSEWDGLLGWEKLFNKCLVDLDQWNRIRMHDHLRDLGREIANEQTPYRLWFRNQIIQVQPQQVGIQIRGIVANATRVNWYSQRKVKINTSQGVRSLKPSSVGLKILVCMGSNTDQGNGDLPRGLIWLCYYNFLHRKLPWFSLQSLRILLLTGARNLENLWDTDADAPLQLRELTIQGCQNFRGFPESIGNMMHLKEIRGVPGVKLQDREFRHSGADEKVGVPESERMQESGNFSPPKWGVFDRALFKGHKVEGTAR